MTRAPYRVPQPAVAELLEDFLDYLTGYTPGCPSNLGGYTFSAGVPPGFDGNDPATFGCINGQATPKICTLSL
jgi:hypothetical protein